MIGPTLEAVLEDAIDAALRSVWTALPGRVLSFDSTGYADVQPIPKVTIDGEAIEIPALQKVPVAYPAGGACRLTYPLEAGDIVLLLFSTLPLARFRADDSEDDPGETRRHDLSDAWCIPIAAGKAVSVPAGKAVLLPPIGGKVCLGAASGQPTVLGTTLRSELDALWLAVQGHVHPGITVGAGVTGPSATLAGPNPVTAAILAAKVEVF